MAGAPTSTPERITEALLEGLEPHEHDFQEFKGSAWLVSARGGVCDNFPLALSKQVSAFANGAGGRLFLGLADDGRVDGGVPVDLRGGTRAWLGDVVPMSVDPPLRRCNIYEVPPREGGPSGIWPGRAVYVLDLPASEDAPHQAKDYRYYLRIAGKSRPMGHVHVQDVLRRTRHPKLVVSRVGPFGEPEYDESDPRGPRVFIQLRAFLTNVSRSLAQHVGLELVLPRSLAGSEVRRRMRSLGETHYTQSPGALTFFRYHPVPIFPTQEVYAASAWIALHGANRGLVRSGGALSWVVYADDAEPITGGKPLADFQVVQRAVAWLDARLDGR
jgi:hypothetical protein